MRLSRPGIHAPAHVSGRLIRLLLTMSVLSLAATAPLALRAAGRIQGEDEVFMASLQSELRSDTGDAATTDAVLLGQEGFGAAIVEAKNLSDELNDMTLDLTQQTGGAPSSLSREVEPLSVARFGLEGEASLEGGYYAGRLSGSGPLGAIARLRWPSGATAAYEAAPAARG